MNTKTTEVNTLPNDFMPHHYAIEKLLIAALDAIQYIPVESVVHAKLSLAINSFKTFTTSNCAGWSEDDVPESVTIDGKEVKLTESERKNAICRFTQNFEISDQDWSWINSYAEEEAKSRNLNIRVEYSKDYTGGELTGQYHAEYVLVSVAEIEKNIQNNMSGEEAIEQAFKDKTGIDPIHILYNTTDELYNDYDELVEVFVFQDTSKCLSQPQRSPKI